jgi:hypothetical protein
MPQAPPSGAAFALTPAGDASDRRRAGGGGIAGGRFVVAYTVDGGRRGPHRLPRRRGQRQRGAEHVADGGQR